MNDLARRDQIRPETLESLSTVEIHSREEFNGFCESYMRGLALRYADKEDIQEVLRRMHVRFLNIINGLRTNTFEKCNFEIRVQPNGDFEMTLIDLGSNEKRQILIFNFYGDTRGQELEPIDNIGLNDGLFDIAKGYLQGYNFAIFDIKSER